MRSVPVLGSGHFGTMKELLGLLGPSRYITGSQRQHLRQAAEKRGLDPDRCCSETDLSGLMEGLYVKTEENGRVTGRMKYVRAGFLQCVDFSETHWIDKPIIPNQLAAPA